MKVKDNKGGGGEGKKKHQRIQAINRQRHEALRILVRTILAKRITDIIRFIHAIISSGYSGIEFIKESSKSETSLSITPREPFN